MAPVAIIGVFFFPPLAFAVFVGAVLTVAGWEWANLAGIDGWSRYVYGAVIAAGLTGVYFVDPLFPLLVSLLWWLIALVLVVTYPRTAQLWYRRWLVMLLGFVVLLPAFISMVILKAQAESTFLILLLFFLIWGADIGAYFSGRALGKRKLAPAVSPGKSWAGVVGGLLTAGLIAAGMAWWAGYPQWLSGEFVWYLVAAIVVAIVSVLGDLAISMFKRERGVKDSSQLLPGHGGVLDRIDSLLSAGPVFGLLLIWLGWR